MKRSKAVPASTIASVLSRVLHRMQAEGQPSIEEMAQTWKRLAGEEAALHSWPKRLNQRRLVVDVENSGWMHTLKMSQASFQEGLVELMGAGRVREISFRIGERLDA